jgi:LacI family transcriptional regulator
MVTIKDMAGAGGVSVTAVAAVLSEAPSAQRISEKTRKRIRRIANKLGYRPNLFARSLHSNRSRTLGVVVFDITDP